MKKLLIIIGICILLVGMPLTTVVFSQKIQIHQNMQTLNINESVLPTDTPPNWATGYFVGVIGMTNSTGHPQSHRGIIAGYCSDDFKGRFAGVIAKNTESEPVGYIGGYICIPFMFGIIGNISSKKQTSMVGLGICNETHFYLRIMTLVGPTFYMAGKYSLLQQ